MFYGGHRIIAASSETSCRGVPGVGRTDSTGGVGGGRVWLVLGLLGFSLAMLGVEHLLGLRGLGEMMQDVPVAGPARAGWSGPGRWGGLWFPGTAGSEETAWQASCIDAWSIGSAPTGQRGSGDLVRPAAQRDRDPRGAAPSLLLQTTSSCESGFRASWWAGTWSALTVSRS